MKLIIYLFLASLCLAAASAHEVKPAKINVCHAPPGSPESTQRIWVGLKGKALAAHMKHGDWLVVENEICDAIADNNCDRVPGTQEETDASCNNGEGEPGNFVCNAGQCEPDNPNLSIGNGQATEFNNITQVPVSLSVILDAPTSSTVTVNWATEDGTATAGEDYLSASGQLTFDPNMTDKSLTVFIIGDDTSEPLESFFVRLSLPSGANLLNDLGEVVIYDDDDIDD